MVALFAQQSNIVEFPTKSNEWYTPSKYIEAARQVMGGIDLDPASCELANRTVKATRFYTAKENGLAQEWHGRVWLNPPYSQGTRARGGLFSSTIEGFTQKLLEEYRTGNVEQAILLVAARVNSLWFTPMWQYSICFPDHTIAFHGRKNDPKNTLKHLWGSCFIYLGKNEQKFINIFSQFGTVARRVSVPKVQPVNLSLWEVQP